MFYVNSLARRRWRCFLEFFITESHFRWPDTIIFYGHFLQFFKRSKNLDTVALKDTPEEEETQSRHIVPWRLVFETFKHIFKKFNLSSHLMTEVLCLVCKHSSKMLSSPLPHHANLWDSPPQWMSFLCPYLHSIQLLSVYSLCNLN